MYKLSIICDKVVDQDGIYSASVSSMLNNGDSIILISDLSETRAQYYVQCSESTAHIIISAADVEVL